MSLDPAALPDEVLTFLGEYHLATLTTLRNDLSPHVVAVGFSYDTGACVARVISRMPSATFWIASTAWFIVWPASFTR